MPYLDVCSDGTRGRLGAIGEPQQMQFGDEPPIPCPQAGLWLSTEYVPAIDDHIAVAQGHEGGYLWVSRKERRAETRHPAPCGTQCILVISDGRILIADCGPGQGTDGWAYFDYPGNVPVNMNRIIHDPPVHMGVAFIRAYRHYDWEIGQTNLGDFYVAWNYAAPGVVWHVGPSYGSPVQPKIRQMGDGSAVAALTAGPGVFVRSAEFTPLAVTPPQPIPPTPTPQPPIVIPAGVPRLVPATAPFRLYVYQQPGLPQPDDYDWVSWPQEAGKVIDPSVRELQIGRDGLDVPAAMIDYAWDLVTSGVRPNVRLVWNAYPQEHLEARESLKQIRRTFCNVTESGLPWAPVTAWYRGVKQQTLGGQWTYAWSLEDVILHAQWTWRWFAEAEGDFLHAWIWTRANGEDGLVKWPELMAVYEQVRGWQRAVGIPVQPGTVAI